MRVMKNSGIEWIGDIPNEWEIIKSKYIFTNHKEIVGDKEKEFERLSLTLNGVLKRPKDDNKGLQSDSLSTYQILYQNELVFKMIDLENISTSRVGYSEYTGLVSPVYIIFNNDEYSRYGYWYFYNLWQRNIYNTLGNNNVRSALNASDMLELPFIKMPLPEQQRIADFLDRKCAEIDTVIEKTKTTIEEYKKLKQSIITEAVTKGIRGNRPMKDSGVEWIESVPSEWEVTRVKSLSTELQKGNGITKEDVVMNGDTPCVRYGEIYTKYNQSFSECETKTNREIISIQKYFSYGDILFTCTGELVEEIGKSIVYLGSGKCLAGGDIIIMSHKQNPTFLNYALNSAYAQAQKSCDKTKLKVVHISADDICNIAIALPPIFEQQEIANYLDKQCSKIDKLISDKAQLLYELENLKKSLIYEYVTGKKEVM